MTCETATWMSPTDCNFFREFLEISDDPLILLDRNRKAHKLFTQTL